MKKFILLITITLSMIVSKCFAFDWLDTNRWQLIPYSDDGNIAFFNIQTPIYTKTYLDGKTTGESNGSMIFNIFVPNSIGEAIFKEIKNLKNKK